MRPLFIIKYDHDVFLWTFIRVKQFRLVLVRLKLVVNDEVWIRLTIDQLLSDVILNSVTMVS